MKEKIEDSLRKYGFSHVLKERISFPELEALCRENGWVISDADANYTFTVMRSDAPKGGTTDWEGIRKEQQERRQKAAARKKKNTPTT